MTTRLSLLALAVCLSGVPALAQSPVPADADMRKQRFLRDILDAKDGAQGRSVERDRRGCAGGVAAANDRLSRAEGLYFLPDSSDTCIATLTRTARDGRLPVLYRILEKDLTGDERGHEYLPGAIGAAAMKNESVVALGDGKGMTLKPALAFDAGFTVGFLQGFGGTPPTITDMRLKAISEGCLDQQGSLNNCFLAGRIHGFRAKGPTLSAR